MKLIVTIKRGDLVIEREVTFGTDGREISDSDATYFHVASVRRKLADMFIADVVEEEFEIDYRWIFPENEGDTPEPAGEEEGT